MLVTFFNLCPLKRHSFIYFLNAKILFYLFLLSHFFNGIVKLGKIEISNIKIIKNKVLLKKQVILIWIKKKKKKTLAVVNNYFYLSTTDRDFRESGLILTKFKRESTNLCIYINLKLLVQLSHQFLMISYFVLIVFNVKKNRLMPKFEHSTSIITIRLLPFLFILFIPMTQIYQCMKIRHIIRTRIKLLI